MRARVVRGIAVVACAAAIGVSCVAAEDAAAGAPVAATPAPAATPAATPRWSFQATANAYLLPDDENYVQPIVIARRDRLHLEARYNYEDRSTGSLYAGYAFSTGTTVEFEAIPMLGAVVGRTDGVAAGCTLTLAWKQLAVYSENEYVVDFADRESNFFYDWSEVTWEPADWAGVGLVSQRTRVYETDRDLQRGVMARFAKGAFTGAVYWFNPGSADDFAVVSFGAGF
jgi:hypothetical protein